MEVLLAHLKGPLTWGEIMTVTLKALRKTPA